MSETVVSAVRLTKSYPVPEQFPRSMVRRMAFKKSEIFLAVDHLSFEIEKGETFGFLGPNGAGKTTTIRLLTTTIKPTSGRAEICGHDIVESPNEVRKCIGYLPEKLGFYENMNALDNLSFYGEFYDIDKKIIKERGNELLIRMGLEDAVDKKISMYSHGMKKRLGLAQALLHEPELLILDEPTSGLDPLAARDFKDLVKTLNQEGKTIFFSSHLLSEVQEICNRVLIIKEGKAVALDNIENLSKKIAKTSHEQTVVEGYSFEQGIPMVKDLDGVLEIQRQDYGIIVVCKLGSNLTSTINDILVRMGAKVSMIRRVDPTLEDVFISLTQEAGENR